MTYTCLDTPVVDAEVLNILSTLGEPWTFRRIASEFCYLQDVADECNSALAEITQAVAFTLGQIIGANEFDHDSLSTMLEHYSTMAELDPYLADIALQKGATEPRSYRDDWTGDQDMAAIDGVFVLGYAQRWTGAPVTVLNAIHAPVRPAVSSPQVHDLDAYATAVLTAELANVRAAGEGRRANTLNRAAFKIGQVADRCQLGVGVLDALVDAAVSVGLTERHARGIVHSGFDAGARTPRSK